MKLEMDCVNHFHQKLGVSAPQQMSTEAEQPLAMQARLIIAIADELESKVSNPDKRFLRAHLLAEECGECILAMAQGDEIKALDGLTDLLYVLLGTALTFEWPLEEAFGEVHRSNLTKVKQETDASKDRVREKGAAYQPPNLEAVLALAKKGSFKFAPSGLSASLERAFNRAQDSNPILKLDRKGQKLIRRAVDAMLHSPDLERHTIALLNQVKEV